MLVRTGLPCGFIGFNVDIKGDIEKFVSLLKVGSSQEKSFSCGSIKSVPKAYNSHIVL